MIKKKFRLKPKKVLGQQTPIFRELMPHQRDAVDYLVRQSKLGRGGALFMEMRLGKTLSMIRFLARPENLHRKVVILAPLPVCKSWENELKADGFTNFVQLAGLDKKKKLEKLRCCSWQFCIVNYESSSLVEIHRHISKEDVVIADESIVIANPKSKITKYLCSQKFFPQRLKYVLCGEPAPESKLQYVMQMMFCQGKFMLKDSFWSYRSQYWDQYGYDWIPSIGHSQKMQEYIHDRSFILTRAQAGIGSKKIYEARYSSMTSAQKKAYKQMLIDFETDDVSTNFITVQLLYLARIAGGQKLKKKPNPDDDDFEDRLDEDIEWYSLNKFNDVLDTVTGELKNESVVIWFRFRNELHQFSKMLESKKEKFVVVHGDVPVEDREIARQRFMAGKVRLSLMTISTSKRGSDWSKADTAIYFSNEYSGDARAQSEDRIVHPKKQTPLLVIDQLTEGSVDEDVVLKLTEKKIQSKLFRSKILESIRSKREQK